MSEKIIGVSPPLPGKAQDSKVDLNKDLKETSSGQYKTDFEKALKEKLALKQKEKKEAPETNRKEAQVKKDEKELKAEKKDRKSSGGTKKKMTEKSDEQKISNVMASSENEVEIPESKTDLAEFEASHPNIEALDQPKIAVQAEQLPKTDEQIIEVKPQQTESKLSIVDSEFVDVQPHEVQELTQQETFQPLIPKKIEEPLVQLVSVDPNSEIKAKAQAFDLELATQVGFQGETGLSVKSEELIQKMKAFEVEKNISTDKAQDFEKSVLDQLQKMNGVKVVEGYPTDTGSSGKQSSGDQLTDKNLKLDQTNLGDVSHTGQSHGEFKTHFGSAAQPASELAHLNKLEENHEQNVKEVMNQAQYLVKKGGGEMNVKLSPDGLAEVQLKVIVLDGKVNIEMVTQDKAVKKLMEDSLSELKSGLAAHHLSIEHVKISSVNATNTDNNAQLQSNLNQSGSEEKQREFWNRFQDNLNQSNSRKANYPSVASSAQDLAVERSRAPAESSLRTYGGTKGSQVNRVA